MKNNMNDSMNDSMNDVMETKNVKSSGDMNRASSANGMNSINGFNGGKKNSFLKFSESVRAKKIQMFFMKSKIALGDSIPPHEIRKIRKDIARELSGVDISSIESKSVVKSGSKLASKPASGSKSSSKSASKKSSSGSENAKSES